MALTGAKPFLKNISKEIHSKALADNTRTILSLKTEQNTCGKNTYRSASVMAGVRRFKRFRHPIEDFLFPLDGVTMRRSPGGSPSSSFVRHRTEYK